MESSGVGGWSGILDIYKWKKKYPLIYVYSQELIITLDEVPDINKIYGEIK